LRRGGPPRKLGAVNRITRELKEAIFAACKKHGSDGEGSDGLLGYMFMLARDEPKTMGALLGRLLPMEMSGSFERHVVPSRAVLELGDAISGISRVPGQAARSIVSAVLAPPFLERGGRRLF
jgi:hypothetical protein